MQYSVWHVPNRRKRRSGSRAHRKPVSARGRAYGWGQAAWQAALRHLPEALGWYEKSAGTLPARSSWPGTPVPHRAQDWACDARLPAMLPAMAGQPDWTCTGLRARSQPWGRQEEARQQYLRTPVSRTSTATWLTRSWVAASRCRRAAPPNTADELVVAEVAILDSSALALFRRHAHRGRREWVWSLRGMDDRALAAAEFARRSEVWDRAINTADRTQVQHNYQLLLHCAVQRPGASQRPTSWRWTAAEYGLMRQESRFVTNAKSSVGARGLMQLMPATAKWVAKKIQLANFQPARVADMDTNVTLGMNYLKMVLDSLDNHPVLASAAYNAGPRATPLRWRADRRWGPSAETIPSTRRATTSRR